MAADKSMSEADLFWKEKEEFFGGPIQFKSFATLIGLEGAKEYNGRGGLCFIINNQVYFEDFEKNSPMMALFNKKDKEYEKMELIIPLDSIKNYRTVSFLEAKSCIKGEIDAISVGPLNVLKRLFSRRVLLIEREDEPAFFCEIMEEKNFLKFLK